MSFFRRAWQAAAPPVPSGLRFAAHNAPDSGARHGTVRLQIPARNCAAHHHVCCASVIYENSSDHRALNSFFDIQ